VEYTTVWAAGLAGILLVIGSIFYSLGGRKGKWLRRFVGSFIISLAVWIPSLIMHNFYWWYLAIFPLLAIGFSLGYGADIIWEKILKRSVFALAVLSSALLCAIVVGGNGWLLLVYAVGVGAWSVWLGVTNPVEAAGEEFLICMTLNLGLMGFPFVVA